MPLTTSDAPRSDPKGAVSASTQNSPSAPAESPVARRTVRETGRVNDKVHTRQTTAAHAAQDRSRRDPPGTTASRGPERVRRGARPAPLPRQGPAAGTTSPVLGRPPRAPRSHPVKPGVTAPGVGEGTTTMGKPTGAPRATGPDEERRTNAGPRGTPVRHAPGNNHGTRTDAEPQQPRTREARTTHDEPRHGTRFQGQPGPHARTPHPRPVGSGPRPHAEKDDWSGVGECPSPDAPHPGKRRPPRGVLVRPPQRAKPARKSARCGVGDGSPRSHPPHPQPVGSGPRPPARKDEWPGVGERPTWTPNTQARGAPPGQPHAAPTAIRSARCGVGDGSPSLHPPQPQPVGNGPWPHARTDERSRVGERPSPDAPHPGKRCPPRAPLCCPHSAQSQLAEARAVGWVTGPHARNPHTHSQWVVGPGRTPERTRGWGWGSARPRTPQTQARGAPPEHPHAAPTACKASSQERALWGW